MAFEEHPYREGPPWRLGAPVAAIVLAVVLFGAMLGLGPGGLRTTVVVAPCVVQAALMFARGLARRRAGRLADPSFRGHQFVMLWSVQAGLTWIVSGEDTAVSAAIYVLTGLVFAVLLTGFLWFTEGSAQQAPTASGTQPLPITDDG